MQTLPLEAGCSSQPPQVQHGTAGRDTCGHFFDGGLRCITWNTRGLVGSVFSSQKNRELKLKYFRKLLDNNNIICLQEVHGKDEFLQATQVLVPRFGFFWYFQSWKRECRRIGHLHPQELLPEEAIVTLAKAVTHIVRVQSGRQSPVTVNVHFEPELTLRRLRERLRLITPQWPSCPNAVGIILGDFNICEPEEGRFNGWNQTFTDGDAGKTAMFDSFFSMFSRLLNLITPGVTPQPLGSYALCQGLIASLLTYLWLRRETFHCYSHVSENLGNRTIPSDHAAVRLVIQKPTDRGQQDKRIPSWMSKHPVFRSSEAASR